MSDQGARFDSDLGVFVEEVTADLVRFEMAAAASCRPDVVAVGREVPLGASGLYGDILATAPDGTSQLIEVKIGYSSREIVGRIAQKYGRDSAADPRARRLALVVRRGDHADWDLLERDLRQAVPPHLALEFWDEAQLAERLRHTFGDGITDLTSASLLDTRRAIERAYWRFAFGGAYADHPSAATLQWHFSPWELHRLHAAKKLAPEQILAPGEYRQAVAVLCDLCSFSGFVRDTPDTQLIRRRLTEFYSLARHTVHNAGGMIYQFVGDEVVAIFGLHDDPRRAAASAIRCVDALFDIGHAVSDAWQRALDRVQPSRGVHIGLAAGDLNLLPLRPFSRTHFGFIGDAINIAARLMAEAKADEAVLSNSVFRLLDDGVRSSLFELEPIHAKNVGQIRAWKMQRGTAKGGATAAAAAPV